MRSKVLVGILVAATLAMAAPARAADVTMLISNFRFCIDRPIPCDPADMGYVPDSNGKPVAPIYNDIVTPTVTPGTTITWRWDDDMCDALSGCAGHEVRLMDGTLVGRIDARNGNPSFSWTVPANTPEGVLPYYCTISSHYRVGMTGAIEVAAAS